MRHTVSGGAARAAAAVSAAALVLAACSSIDTPSGGGQSPTADDRAAQNGGTLVVALSDEPDPLDPTTARTLVGRSVFMSICEKLYDINAKLDIVPQLAASMPQISADGKTVTIKLRVGRQVRRRHRAGRGRGEDQPGPRPDPADLRPQERSGQRRQRVGDRSVHSRCLHLKAPFAPLVAQLADRAGMVMSPAALKSEGTNFGAHPVCVGPFKFQSRVAQDHIDVVKDANYYDASNVHLDKVSYKIIADSTTRFNNLQLRRRQVLDAVAATDVDALQADSNLHCSPRTRSATKGITINIGNVNGVGKPAGRCRPPASAMATDPRVRRRSR
jgi:peptide/nickel transport system substrate-binding protein